MTSYLRKTCASFAVGLLVTGCAAAPEKPDSFAVPVQPTCFSLSEALEATEIKGLLKYEWRTRLERGAYVAVHESERGTYFRGPPGAVLIYQPTMLDKPSSPASHMTVNGGVFVPRDGSQPELYTYITDKSVDKVTPPAGASCATAVVVRDPVSKGVSVKDYAIFGGASGALGGLAAHDKAPNSSMRQTVGVGAAGGSAAMAIVGALINMDVGKIGSHSPTTDPKFNARLATLARTAAPFAQ
jgi:hypothetical protein